MTATAELVPATRDALALLLLAMADDELVLGFSDSEWTGIAPLLEEDVAMSSLAQDELGHAQALYRLLADLVDDGRDADVIAYDRPAEGYYHARLLDHPRGDWATAIARRYLYDTADAVLAVHYAREMYSRRQESVRLWVVRRADIHDLDDPDLLQPPLDRSFKKPGGYVMRDKLAAARAQSGQAKPKAKAK